jgi:hypothetical protein
MEGRALDDKVCSAFGITTPAPTAEMFRNYNTKFRTSLPRRCSAIVQRRSLAWIGSGAMTMSF